MYSRILNCDYEFVSPWWDEVSLNAKDLVSHAVPKDLSPQGPWTFSRPFVPSLTLCCPGLWQVSKLIVLDPRQRLSVREALDHPWVLGKAARFSHMDTAQKKLQEFNARRKLKVRLQQVQGVLLLMERRRDGGERGVLDQRFTGQRSEVSCRERESSPSCCLRVWRNDLG